MTPIPTPLQRLSAAEYRRREADSPVKHEYIDGFTCAMPSETARHNLLVGNVFVALKTGLRGEPFDVYALSMKVRVANQLDSGQRFYYPDVMVAPVTESDRDKDYETDPVLIIEVASPTSELRDLFDKKVQYFSLNSLSEYLVVMEHTGQAFLSCRDGEKRWIRYEYSDTESIPLQSIDYELLPQDRDAQCG